MDGFSYEVTAGDAEVTPTQGGFDFQVKSMGATVTISPELCEASKASQRAYIDYVVENQQRLLESFKNNFGRMLFHEPTWRDRLRWRVSGWFTQARERLALWIAPWLADDEGY